MQFSQLAQSVLELDTYLDRLRENVEPFGVPSPEQQHWYALLKHKLVPQLLNQTYLIAAVMGGTNTGKSLIFNHLAGETVSAVDYRASGTKHPVCTGNSPCSSVEGLVPPADIQSLFDDFDLISWSNSRQPLEENTQDSISRSPLFYKEIPTVPEHLLLLDTPDIDSDREVNWDRARAVRNAADVILAVLTEQKYNDAAVRKFFREAAEAGKPILVLFNMFDMQNDAEQLPRWLSRFCTETGMKPLAVFVAPFDKEKAEQRNLPFYTYEQTETDGSSHFNEVNLIEQLMELHFDTIKSQTLLGAVNAVNNPDNGLLSYLKTIEQTSQRFTDALKILENVEETTVDWPALPVSILTDEIRLWWNSERPNWSQSINKVYRTVGKTLTFPLRKVSRYVASNFFGTQTPSSPPLENFQTLEQRAVIDLAGSVIKHLEKLADTDNPVLKHEIDGWVSGEHRGQVIERSLAILRSLEPVNEDFRAVLRQHLTDWTAENPKSVLCLRYLDSVATICRPVITLSLAASGLAVGSHIIGPVVTDALLPAAIGEAALQFGSDGLSGSVATLFRNIQTDFVQKRSKQFLEAFRNQLWLTVIEKLRTGAGLTQTEIFENCKNWSQLRMNGNGNKR